MCASVLVGHATKYNSTRGAAEAVAETLRGCGLTAECQSISKVRSLDGYGALRVNLVQVFEE